jgi:myo-inositol catabolism protein IolC
MEEKTVRSEKEIPEALQKARDLSREFLMEICPPDRLDRWEAQYLADRLVIRLYREGVMAVQPKKQQKKEDR